MAGITELTVDNLNLNGNAITSTDTNGDITLTPNGTGKVIVSSDLAVNGGDITTSATTATLFNTTATTLTIGHAATTVSIGDIGHSGTTTINNDLAVYGTITFSQGASTLSATTIQIDDTLISLADNNTADILDIGFYAGYRQSSTDYHTGFVRDASDSGTWKLFSGIVAQPTGTVDFTSAVYDILQLSKVKYAGSSSGSTTVQAAASASGTLTLPAATDTLVGKATTDTLTNKTISGSDNTVSNIGNSSLTNSKVTIGSTDVSLGATVTTFAGLSSVTSTTFVGALTGNASTATTLQTSRTIAFTGDATASGSFNGSANYSQALTLATVNSNTGSFGSSTEVPVITVNAKGLITAVSTATVSADPAGTAIAMAIALG